MFRRTLFLALALLLPLLNAGCGAGATPTAAPALIAVPQARPPTIDGTLSPGEWDAAAVESFADGSELLLMSGDGYLYLGIRSNTAEMIVGNVFVDL